MYTRAPTPLRCSPRGLQVGRSVVPPFLFGQRWGFVGCLVPCGAVWFDLYHVTVCLLALSASWRPAENTGHNARVLWLLLAAGCWRV